MMFRPAQPGDFPGLTKLWQQAFGDTDAFLDSFFGTAFSPERCLCIRLEERVAAALYWFDCQWEDKRLAYLYAVATENGFKCVERKERDSWAVVVCCKI